MENLRARRQAYLEAQRQQQTRQARQVKKKLNEARDQIDKDACRAAFETKFTEKGHFGNALAYFPACTQKIQAIPGPWYQVDMQEWERDNPGYIVRETSFLTEDGSVFFRHVHMTLEAFPEFSKK